MDRHTSSSTGTPAPYGHACVSCAQSKIKCIIRPAGGQCERCYRLNRECRPVESVRRRGHKKPVVTKTKKAARLEEKLDGIISLIKTGAEGSAVVTPQTTTSLGSPVPEHDVQMNAGAQRYHHVDGGSFPGSSNDHTHNLSRLSTTTPDYSDSACEPSTVEAEKCLLNFRTYKSKYFPFVYILPTINAQQLQQERPFLWLCVMAVGSKSTAQQQILGRRIRQTVAQEMVIRSAKSIDLLLGLLAFIGWASYQIQSEPFLTLFTQLAVSLVFDLGLTKSLSKENQVTPCGTLKYAKPIPHRTMEERRAVLACFLSTSIISSFLQRIDTLRWTPHMDDCLQKLDEGSECPNDKVLVQQVRLQLLVERMALEISHNEAMGSPSFHLETLHSQFQGMEADILQNHPNNDAILLHMYSTKLDLALSPTFLHTSQSTPEPHKDVKAGLEAIKSWFDVFFTIPPAAYIGLPFSILSQLFRCLVTLYRLRILDDPACQENGIWESADPLSILDRAIGNMEQVAMAAGLDNSGFPGGDLFSRFAQLLRSFRLGWETKLHPGGPMISGLSTQNADEIPPFPDFLGMEFLDNDWFTEFCLPPS